MSAVLQLPVVWGAGNARRSWLSEPATGSARSVPKKPRTERDAEPIVSLAFYRKHTESMLRRYLYASMQVGRAPSILGDPVGRGWVSSRPVRTFEDAVIFVLDVEKCLSRIGALDRLMLSRIVLQEYTQTEAAALLGISPRTLSYKFPLALDRLTEKLLEMGLLVLPNT
ncbi:MAG TPA: helix-turn-helix domain-containing protein [Terracidiphilus sp.]|nr:helix-turn-helix domain-containing protein [Terracidiphilus sp.]